MVKIGPFGSTAFEEGNHDITVALQRLQSITIRHGFVVDAVAFTYKDSNGLEHTTGQWGGNGGSSTTVSSMLYFYSIRIPDLVTFCVYPSTQITLEPHEFVKEVHGLYGFYTYGACDGVANFTIVTNLRTYGPFGQSDKIKEPKSFDIPIMNNGSIVGFFAHCNKIYVEAIGFYVKPF